MTEEIAGFQTSPKAQVQAAFEEIARRSMHDLSFLHPSMPMFLILRCSKVSGRGV